MRHPSDKSVLELKHISVQFPENGVTANKNVSMCLEPGEVVGIVGENGAGKSTLMHVMAGVVQPSEGTIKIYGEPCSFTSPADAIGHGIVMVSQHPKIVKSISSWENAILGIEPGWWIGKSHAKEMFTEVSETYGLHVDPDRNADNLSAHEAFDLALLSALLRKPRVLLLDEPVTAFTQSGVQDISSIIQQLVEGGMSVAYISHKIDEVLTICTRVVVMRSGEIVTSLNADATDAETIATFMLGENSSDISDFAVSPKGPPSENEVVFSLDSVEVEDPAAGTIGPISFEVRKGECLAIAGMRDRGITAIEELLSGHLPARSGSIAFLGDQMNLGSPHALRSRGIAYIPTDRLIRGSSLHSTLADNMILLTYRKLQRWGFFKSQEIMEFSSHLKGSFHIHGEPAQDLSTLSGGNIQKTILSRELSGDPRLIILSEPSWGLDILSRQTVYERIRELCNRGSAVIVITTDIEEAYILGNRFAVMFGSEFIPVEQDGTITKDELGAIALGIRRSVS